MQEALKIEQLPTQNWKIKKRKWQELLYDDMNVDIREQVRELPLSADFTGNISQRMYNVSLK